MKAYHGKYTTAHQPNPFAGKYSKALSADGGGSAYKAKVAPPASTPKPYASSMKEARDGKPDKAPEAQVKPAGSTANSFGEKKNYASMMSPEFKGKY